MPKNTIMRKIIFYILFLLPMVGCSTDSADDIPDQIIETEVVKYKVNNNVLGETITILALEDKVNSDGTPNFKTLGTLDTGVTSTELSSIGAKVSSGSLRCDLLFRSSFKDGVEVTSFFTTKTSKIIVSLSKDRGGYRAEVIDEL